MIIRVHNNLISKMNEIKHESNESVTGCAKKLVLANKSVEKVPGF